MSLRSGEVLQTIIEQFLQGIESTPSMPDTSGEQSITGETGDVMESLEKNER